MIKFITAIYSLTPKSFRNRIGKLKFLKPLRDKVLRSDGDYKETNVLVQREYQNYKVKFRFNASIKVASMALNRGIETKILNNSISLLNQYLKHDNDCAVLDVGANFGFLSLVWSQSIAMKGRVYSFEPNTNVYNSYNKSVLDNNLNKTIISENLAVGNEDKYIKLFLNNTTSNVVNTDHTSGESTVEMIKIDTYIQREKIQRCDLIKIDVDGIELDILQGCVNTLVSCRPIFIVETNNDKGILDFFKAYDYKILDMELEEYISNTKLPFNIFCIPN